MSPQTSLFLISGGIASLLFMPVLYTACYTENMDTLGYSIVIATPDNDEAMSKFYTDILGFVKNEFGGYEKHGLTLYFDRHSKAAKTNPEAFRHMLTLQVPDIKVVYADLKEKGLTFVREIESEDWGGQFATFVDPDGNFVQIVQMPSH